MKQFEYIQKEIQTMNSGMAIAGFLNGLELAATAWCKKNAPDDIYINENNKPELTIYGMASYLDSEIDLK